MRIGHTSVHKGKRVIVYLKNGERLLGRFKEKLSKDIVLYEGKIAIENIRSVVINKSK